MHSAYTVTYKLYSISRTKINYNICYTKQRKVNNQPVTDAQFYSSLIIVGGCGGSMLGPGGTGPLNLAQPPPQIFRVIMVHKLLNTGQFDKVVLLVVASQMMRP